MKVNKPIVIAFVGIDGAGKSLQIMRLYNWLTYNGFLTKKTKAKITTLSNFFEYCKNQYENEYSIYPDSFPEYVRIGVAYDTWNHFVNLRTNYLTYDFILCDRYALCYRAFGLPYGPESNIVSFIYNMIEEPDLYIYLDVEVSIAMDRIKKRGLPAIDENCEYLDKVNNFYKTLFKSKNNVITINANLSKNIIFDCILDIIKGKWKL